jgi:SPASM domain peptide maturase of grasp-with-spasm system
MSKQFFKLYSNCIPVKGASRSCIYDLQRKNLYYIPNEIYHLLTSTLGGIEEQSLSKEEIEKVYSMMCENEIGFFTNSPDEFPDIDLTFDTPEIINNVILVYGEWFNSNCEKVFDNFKELMVKNLEVRVFGSFDINFLKRVCALSKNTFIRDINFIIQHSNTLVYEQLEDIVNEYPRVGNIYVHSCIHDVEGDKYSRIFYTKNKIYSNNCCGNINLLSMFVNLDMFSEAQSFNTCLNKKIAIDEDGNIKNCPSMVSHYGNINELSLMDVVYREDFMKLMSVKKDDIKVCQDCEYRYSCYDCRAFVVEDLYSKPLKCSYDPYTGIWKDTPIELKFNKIL